MTFELIPEGQEEATWGKSIPGKDLEMGTEGGAEWREHPGGSQDPLKK